LPNDKIVGLFCFKTDAISRIEKWNNYKKNTAKALFINTLAVPIFSNVMLFFWRAP
jgi:hypothetical protein